MKNLSGKLLGLLLIGAISIPSVSSASSVNTDSLPEEVPIPEGYQVISEYDINDDNNKVSNTVEFVSDSDKQPDSFRKNTEIAQESSSNGASPMELISNETHLYRELINKETGEKFNQYVADVSAQAVPREMSTVEKDAYSDVTVTIRVFYHAKVPTSGVSAGLTFVGLDKIYYRYDGTPGRSTIAGVQGLVTQQGPGINGQAQNQQMSIPFQAGPNLGDTILVNLQNKNWVEVYEEGFLTSVGIQLTAGVNNQIAVHDFYAHLRILGEFPLG